MDQPKLPADKPTVSLPPRPFDCLSCGHFLVADPKDPVRFGGTCHRMPPVPILVGVSQNQFGQQQPHTLAFWPVVGKGDWCGEHTATAIASRLAPDGAAVPLAERPGRA